MKRPLDRVWNIVLTGYPRSGKTVLARRLVSSVRNIVRLSTEDVRHMLFHEPYPSRDEELVLKLTLLMRDCLLRMGTTVVIDSTAHTNRLRTRLLTTAEKASSVLVVVDADRNLLTKRGSAVGRPCITVRWDRFWEKPKTKHKMIRVKSNTHSDLEIAVNKLIRRLKLRRSMKTAQ